MHSPSGDRSRVTLSTGHEITLPLELEFAMGGVTVPARRDRLESILPADLSALALAPEIGCATFAGIRYRRVGGRRDGDDGDDTGLEPYDEFAVVVPAVRGGRTDVPLAQPFGGEIGGYVHWLPVTTDASVALGREIWGYPKERAEISIDERSLAFQCVVADSDTDADTRSPTGPEVRERARLEVPRPRTRVGNRERDRTLWSYATKGGDLLRMKAEIRGEIALGTPLGARIELASDLRAELGCWPRPLARLYGTRVRARLHEGERVANP